MSLRIATVASIRYASIALADFNGDGKADIAETVNNSPVIVQLGSIVGPTVTRLTSSINPSLYGQDVSVTATVSPSTSTGTITFYNGAEELGTANLRDGAATLQIITYPSILYPVGAHSLIAIYGGNAVELVSDSNILTQTVIQSPTSTTLVRSPVAGATSASNVTIWTTVATRARRY